MLIFITELIVTCIYIGKIKYFPGTIASFFTTMICYLIFINVELEKNLNNFIIFKILMIYIMIFFITQFFISKYLHFYKKKDPKEVVVDEFMGQLLTIIISKIVLTKLNIKITSKVLLIHIMIQFIFFRIFDIIKPWPIILIDKHLINSFGVLLDDIIAGIFAFYCYYCFILLTIKLYT